MDGRIISNNCLIKPYCQVVLPRSIISGTFTECPIYSTSCRSSYCIDIFYILEQKTITAITSVMSNIFDKTWKGKFLIEKLGQVKVYKLFQALIIQLAQQKSPVHHFFFLIYADSVKVFTRKLQRPVYEQHNVRSPTK